MSNSKNWLKGSLLLAISGILSRFLGLARDAILARTGGLSLEVDAYNLAFLIPDLLNHFLGAGLLSVTLIPLLAPHFKAKKYEEASRVFSSLFATIFAVMVLLTCLIFWQLEWILELGYQDRITPELMGLTVHYTRIILFAQMFFLAGGFFNAWQYAGYNYTFPALAPLIYNGAIITGGLVSLKTGSVEGFCWGVLAGAALGAGVLQFYGAYKNGLRIKWVKPGPEMKRYLFLTAPFAVGASMTFSNEFLFRYFAVNVEGDTAALGFGLRITMALVGVFGGAVGVAAYPYLSELCSQKQYVKINETVIQTIIGVVLLLLPILSIVAVFAPEMVSLYLGKNGLGAEGIARVVYLLRCYLWVALPMSLQLIVSRIWYADQRTWIPAWISLSLFLGSLPFYNWFEDFGPGRIPLISAFSCFLQLSLLFILWIRKYPEGPWKSLIRPLSVAIILSAISFYSLSPFALPLGETPHLRRLLFALSIAIMGVLLQWFFLYLYGGQEVRAFFTKFAKKIRLVK